jgi:hypothetical protein
MTETLNAIAALDMVANAGASAAVIAQFVQDHPTRSIALSHEVEDRAFEGTVWFGVFEILCGE